MATPIIVRCQTWIAQNYERPDIVAELVSQSGLPKRTFDRRFRAATGYSPLAYIQALRVEEAKHALETSAVPVDAVGREVGYEDAASFRRLFRRLAGMPPGDYRRKFRMPGFADRNNKAARRANQDNAPRPACTHVPLCEERARAARLCAGPERPAREADAEVRHSAAPFGRLQHDVARTLAASG